MANEKTIVKCQARSVTSSVIAMSSEAAIAGSNLSNARVHLLRQGKRSITGLRRYRLRSVMANSGDRRESAGSMYGTIQKGYSFFSLRLHSRTRRSSRLTHLNVLGVHGRYGLGTMGDRHCTRSPGARGRSDTGTSGGSRAG